MSYSWEPVASLEQIHSTATTFHGKGQLRHPIKVTGLAADNKHSRNNTTLCPAAASLKGERTWWADLTDNPMDPKELPC